MFQGVLALLGRSLRFDARSWQPHVARFALMLAIYAALTFAVTTSSLFGAPGLRFFYSIIWLNIVFMTLLGIGFFSTVISEEREEDTLGLMQMAGISPLGILLGKTGGRLLQSLSLIAVQYPFTLLAITMGGVTSNQIRYAYVSLVAYMLFLAGLGLLCSTVAARNRTASTWMIIGLVVYLAVPYFAYELQRFLVDGNTFAATSTWVKVLRWVGSTCLFLEVSGIMNSGFNASPWSTQAVSNVVAGSLCFPLAWMLFGVCTRNPASESTSRGFLTRRRGQFRWFTPGRPHWNPYVWKDFHFVGGGVAMMLVRMVFYFLLLLVSIGLSVLWSTGAFEDDPFEYAISISQGFFSIAVSIEIGLLVSRALHQEIREQTLATLCMLPVSMSFITYSKFAGALLAGLPGACCLAAMTFGTDAGYDNLIAMLEEGVGWFFLAHFALIPHLAMVFALYLRWGFVPLAIAASVGSFFFSALIVESSGSGPHLIGIPAFVVSSVCLICHFWIRLRIRSLVALS